MRMDAVRQHQERSHPLKGIGRQACHIQGGLEPGLVDGYDQAMIIRRTLLHEQCCSLSTQRVPLCHIPEVVRGSRLVREKMQLSPQGRQSLPLSLQELSIISPCRIIGKGTHHVHMHRPILAFERWLQVFQTTE